MMQKNEIVKVKIEDIGVGGEGIGKVDGYTLFIKDAIIGDVVEAKESQEELRLCPPDECPDSIKRPCGRAGLSDGKKMRRLSDPGDEVSGTACI